jgi:hypothetical protein
MSCPVDAKLDVLLSQSALHTKENMEKCVQLQ